MNDSSRGATKMFIDDPTRENFFFALLFAMFAKRKTTNTEKTLFTRNKSRNYWRTSERSQVAKRNAKQPTSVPFLAPIDTCGNVSGRREVTFRGKRARVVGVITESAFQALPEASALRAAD